MSAPHLSELVQDMYLIGTRDVDCMPAGTSLRVYIDAVGTPFSVCRHGTPFPLANIANADGVIEGFEVEKQQPVMGAITFTNATGDAIGFPAQGSSIVDCRAKLDKWLGDYAEAVAVVFTFYKRKVD